MTEPGLETEAKNRLARIGFDHVVGHLADPVQVFNDNPAEVAHSSRLDVAGLEAARDEIADLQLVDLRQPGETADGAIEGAVEIPLTRLNERLATLDASKPTVVYSAGGYQSSIAASRLASAGFDDVSDRLCSASAGPSPAPAPRRPLPWCHPARCSASLPCRARGGQAASAISRRAGSRTSAARRSAASRST